MITVYNSNEVDFSNNGLGVLRPNMCVVSEVLNGLCDLEMEHPFDKEKRWENIIEGNVIRAPAPKGDQLFRVFKKKKTLTGLKIYARHIFYDLVKNFLEDVRPTSLTGTAAIDWILTRTQYPHRFIGFSDITTSNSANYVRMDPVRALIGVQENSFLSRWGGELERDNFNIRLMQAIGQDRGVGITYGKNLVGLDCDVDLDPVITRVMVTGLMADDQILILPEKYVDSPFINAYEDPKIQEYHFPDIKVSDELTTEQAYELLRQKGVELFELYKIDIPPSNTVVNFVELSKTEEYKNYAVLERVYLGDIVTIKHSKINIDLKQKVIKYKWDALLKKYTKLELGDFKQKLADSFNQVNKILIAVSEQIKSNKSDLQKAIDNATELLNTALGGYVVKRPGELLIMDTEDTMTATKVWRWNLNGLGYSSTGINGPYGLAILMDGSINATFITTGILNASLIRTGRIESTDGTTSISLEDGSVSTSILEVQDIVQTAAPFMIKIQSRNQDLFVDLVNGNDSNNGLSWSSPTKTINKALEKLNKYFFNATCRIYVKGNSSDTISTQDCIVQGFCGTGELRIHLDHGIVINGILKIDHNTIHVYVDGYEYAVSSGNLGWKRSGFYIDTDISCCQVYGSPSVHIHDLGFTERQKGIGAGMLVGHGSFVYIEACEINNMWAAIKSHMGGRIAFERVNGSNNTYGAYIFKGGWMQFPQGDSKATMPNSTNGIIFENQTAGWSIGEAPVGADGTLVAPDYVPPVYTPYERISEWGPVSTYSWRDTNGYRSDNSYMYSGEWGGYGNHRGFGIMNSDDIRNALSGAVINWVQIYLYRINTSHGYASSQATNLYSHSNGYKSGYGLGTDVGDINLNRGEGKWVTVSNQLAYDIQNGATGFAIGNGAYMICENPRIKISYTK